MPDASTFPLPDGISLKGHHPDAVITWPNGNSRLATKPEYDLWQIAEVAMKRVGELQKHDPERFQQLGLRANDTITAHFQQFEHGGRRYFHTGKFGVRAGSNLRVQEMATEGDTHRIWITLDGRQVFDE